MPRLERRNAPLVRLNSDFRLPDDPFFQPHQRSARTGAGRNAYVCGCAGPGIRSMTVVRTIARRQPSAVAGSAKIRSSSSKNATAQGSWGWGICFASLSKPAMP